MAVSPMPQLSRTRQAQSFLIALLALIAFSVVSFLLKPANSARDLVLVLCGIPAASMVISIAMVGLKKWKSITGICFVLTSLVVVFVYLLIRLNKIAEMNGVHDQCKPEPMVSENVITNREVD